MSKKKHKHKHEDDNSLDFEFEEMLELRTRDITYKDFKLLQNVRENGVIPLFEITNLSIETGLSSTIVLQILRDYTFLLKKFTKQPSYMKRSKIEEYDNEDW